MLHALDGEGQEGVVVLGDSPSIQIPLPRGEMRLLVPSNDQLELRVNPRAIISSRALAYSAFCLGWSQQTLDALGWCLMPPDTGLNWFGSNMFLAWGFGSGLVWGPPNLRTLNQTSWFVPVPTHKQYNLSYITSQKLHIESAYRKISIYNHHECF